MFGRSPRLPVDLMFDLGNEEQTVNYPDYVKKWKRDIQEAYTLTSRQIEKSSIRSKAFYDKKASSAVLHPGHRVLVRNLSERGGPGKLLAYWEQQIHVVKERIADSPVYRVKPEHGRGKQRVLHRNLLLPCDGLPLDLPTLKRVAHKTSQPTPTISSPTSENGESPDDEYGIDIPYPPAVHDPGPVAEMDIPYVDKEEQRDLAACEETSNALAETQCEPSVDDGPQAAGFASPPETEHTAPECEDSDTEEHPKDRTRPRRDRRPPLALTYNQMGIPEYQHLNPVVDTIEAPQVMSPPVLAGWL